jgi:hypothetical protein
MAASWIRSINAAAASPRDSASSSGSAPNQRASGMRSVIITALPVRRILQPFTSYTVNSRASRGFTAIQVCTPK